MFSRLFSTIILLIFSVAGFSQSCDVQLSGTVKDLTTGEALRAVSVYVKETSGGTRTDSNGFFSLKNICAGSYHLVFSHIGCESQQIFISVKKDTVIQVALEHNHSVLHNVEIKGKLISPTTQNTESLNQQQIGDRANENLSNMLEQISGVSTLRNGNGIAKPVVHGLYGNRITILNNGVAQSGQQWGNDHSPEIDPLVANRIRVVKGVSALEHPGANLGSVILVEPNKINREPHLHGKATYFFESNGRGHGANLQLQQYTSAIAWKVNGTLKKSGDKKAPSYFLNNTGNEEANLALQLEKNFSKKLFTDFYFSTFNTTLGVLRGAHIGNLTDLELAFSREKPFYTEDNFSYAIDAPKQKVQHHLAKLHAKYFINENQFMDFTIAAQINNREEFDVRRSGRSDVPALSLAQNSFFAEGKYNWSFKENWNLNSGVQFNFIDNTNNPETGILPLIPDYRAYESGIFYVLNKRLKKSFFEFGVRYDNVVQDVAVISQTLPRRIIDYQNVFHNLSGSAGWTYSFDEHKQLSYNVGYAMRNPAINELYSGGLHQGVSGLEYGNEFLKTEKSLKTTLALNADFDHHSAIEALVYYQQIADYIFLKPQNEIQYTIRGAFPVFKYEQTNAQIYGLDLSANYEILKALGVHATYSFIKGRDVSNDEPLVNMPANNVSVRLKYTYPKSLKLGNRQIENLEFWVEDRYVFRQDNLNADQDYVLPPDAYNLIGLGATGDLQLSKTRLRIFTRVNNLLNTAYRDYLNRQRYFANDLGINFTIGASLKF